MVSRDFDIILNSRAPGIGKLIPAGAVNPTDFDYMKTLRQDVRVLRINITRTGPEYTHIVDLSENGNEKLYYTKAIGRLDIP